MPMNQPLKHIDAPNLLHRVFVPIERNGVFRTIGGGTAYQRDRATGVIRRLDGKVRGKAARRAAKRQRRVSACQRAASSQDLQRQ